MTIYLDLELMEKVCHPLAVAVFNKGQEPIPPFTAHSNQLLDAALQNPRHTFGGNELHPTILDKACILYYSIIQNHPFQNGNKRIATASLLVFLYVNGYWLQASNEELANWAIKLADLKNQNNTKDEVLAQLKDWLANNIQKM